MCLAHSYVLYVVAMHTEGVIYSRQHYSLTSLIFKVVYCQFCKARLADTQSESQDYWHLTIDPWTSVRLTTVDLVSQARLSLRRRESGPQDYSELVTLVVLHTLKESILGFAEKASR